MSSSANNLTRPLAIDVAVSADTLSVLLDDGRTISVPLSWYPRLAEGTASERSSWELNGAGRGIHWPELDEDISVQALLDGHRSNETESSLDKWRADRRVRGPS
jgi:Protein of unknown function (DUF2442)